MLTPVDVTVETLTPLHIGTGVKLVREFDYVTRGGRTFRLQEERLVEELALRDRRLVDQILRTPPGELLRDEDLREDSPAVRYVLPGEPQGKEFREAIKDAFDRPYLPGSSLKGALRTALAWHGWREVRPGLGAALRERQPKFAARPLERALFGPDPNRDLLRALRVGDSDPVAREALQIQVVQVWTRRGPGAPISVEAVKPGVRFTLQVAIDETLFSEWSRQAQGFPLPHRDWLREILQVAKERARVRVDRELKLWQGWERAGGTNPYAEREWHARRERPGFPLQLGFGTGWEGTTIGAPLKEDPAWPKVHEQFGLGWVPGKRGVQVPPESFPSSRRVVALKGGQLLPLGWVWVEWKEGG